MSRNLAEQLGSFKEGDLSVRVVRGIFSVMPFLPDWRHPSNLAEEVARYVQAQGMDPNLTGKMVAKVEALANGEGAQAALKTLDLMDKADSSIAAFSGIKGVVQKVRGADGALEMDPQQAADAGMKAMGLAFLTYKLFPGTTLERAGSLTATNTGKAILTYFAAVDVVLPFADNLASGGLDLVSSTVDRLAAGSADQLGGDANEAKGVLAAMSGTIKAVVQQAAGFAKPLSDWCQTSLPGVLGAADTATGVAATALDTLSTYRYLGNVLVLESCMSEAKAQVLAEVAAEKVRQEAQRREEEAKSKTDSYSMTGSTSASSLGSTGIKVTRSAELDAPKAGAPAKSGCMGCMGVIVAMLVMGAAGAVWAMG